MNELIKRIEVLEEKMENTQKALSVLINDVWNLHLNGRMTDYLHIYERYEKIGKILDGKNE